MQRFSVLERFKNWLRAEPEAVERAVMTGNHGLPAPSVLDQLYSYVISPWVFTAVSTMAETAANAYFEVWHGEERYPNHPVTDLLGENGKPNTEQDAYELLEMHYSDFLLTGSSYWYLYSRGGRTIDEVHILEPDKVSKVPMRDGTSAYLYRPMAREYLLPDNTVIHHRRYHPIARRYGASGGMASYLDARLDLTMADWNYQYFQGGIFVPDGILVVDEKMSPSQRKELEEDLNTRFAGQRRTAVVGSRPGATAYHEARMKQRDADFEGGRQMARKAIYESYGIPLALFSEDSTEALARVAERQLYRNAYRLSTRTGRKLSADLLGFYPGRKDDAIRPHDIRQADQEQELKKQQARKIQWEMGERPEDE